MFIIRLQFVPFLKNQSLFNLQVLTENLISRTFSARMICTQKILFKLFCAPQKDVWCHSASKLVTEKLKVFHFKIHQIFHKFQTKPSLILPLP